jgi:hypothetical protein
MVAKALLHPQLRGEHFDRLFKVEANPRDEDAGRRVRRPGARLKKYARLVHVVIGTQRIFDGSLAYRLVPLKEWKAWQKGGPIPFGSPARFDEVEFTDGKPSKALEQ